MKSPEINSNKRPNNYDNIKSQSQANSSTLGTLMPFLFSFCCDAPRRGGVSCAGFTRAVFSQDLVTCSACKRGGVTFLKEFDLPGGMEEALGDAGAKEMSR